VWKLAAFPDCQVIEDVALTDEERRTSNLVLIGSPGSNSAWPRLAASLPLRFTREQIEILGKPYKGLSLGVQEAFFNPEQAARKVLLIGSAAPEADFGTMEVSIGWMVYVCDLGDVCFALTHTASGMPCVVLC